MKFGLETISRLCAALGHPERDFQSVIVAGTNGKGSVTAMAHRALVAAGHAAGRYTSPHLERIEERYVLGDREVSGASLQAAAGTVRDAIEVLQRSGGLTAPPTFFECATAIAFVLFREAGMRIAVLEVGLGGRLDATNVVSPIAAAITSIALDHQTQLGDTLESIAFEKAGVIKPGIPVVCGALPDSARRVIRDVCDERRARCVEASSCVDLDGLTGGTPLALAGAHQRANAVVAACLLRELDAIGVRVDEAAIRTGLTGVHWPGRLESFRYGGREVLLDAAHNPEGARALAAYLAEIGWSGCALVFGVMRDKDVRAMLAELAQICGTLICTTPPAERAMPAADVAELAATIPGAAWSVSTVPDYAVAIEAAARVSSRIVAAGSIFLIGPLRGILRPR